MKGKIKYAHPIIQSLFLSQQLCNILVIQTIKITLSGDPKVHKDKGEWEVEVVEDIHGREGDEGKVGEEVVVGVKVGVEQTEVATVVVEVSAV